MSAPHVLLCVTGGIAAYKAPELVRALVGAGATVQVVLTTAAARFVTPLSLATVSRQPVRMDLLDASEEGKVGHIELADRADVVVVAPATANTIAKAAAGLCDDLVSVSLLATRAPILWAPAMNTNMWRHPTTQANLAILAGRGDHFVGPDQGELACGWVGEGRMIDPAVIAARALELAHECPDEEPWRGRRVLVSAGPTREHLDPVRYISNGSTGAMGFAIARAAARRGADVTLVAGPVERSTPRGVRRRDVVTADEMLAAMEEELAGGTYDLVAMTAAVADLVPARRASGKLPKGDLLPNMQALAWTRAVDVLRTLTERHVGSVFFLGFAAETVDDDAEDVNAVLVARGREKLARKGCQALFVNRVGVKGTGFGSTTNAGILLVTTRVGLDVHPSGPSRPKEQLAVWLLDELGPHLSRTLQP